MGDCLRTGKPSGFIWPATYSYLAFYPSWQCRIKVGANTACYWCCSIKAHSRKMNTVTEWREFVSVFSYISWLRTAGAASVTVDDLEDTLAAEPIQKPVSVKEFAELTTSFCHRWICLRRFQTSKYCLFSRNSICSVLREKVYHSKIADVDELKTRPIDERAQI